MKIPPNKIFIRPSITKKISRLTLVIINPMNALIIKLIDKKSINFPCTGMKVKK